MTKPESVEFTLRLFDDESTKEKLTVMNQMDAMFDDERNIIPEQYYELVTGLQPGESIHIEMRKVSGANKIPDKPNGPTRSGYDYSPW